MNLDDIPVKGIQNNNNTSITTYDEMPLMNLSRVHKNPNTQSKYSMERGRLEPNFKSDAYKEEAKEIYKRRMHYNPREAASKSKDRPVVTQTVNASIAKIVNEPIVQIHDNMGRNQN